MRVASVPVDAAMFALLPGTQMSDAYRLTVDDMAIDARTAAMCAFGRVPRWIRGLIILRNCLVSPFGLKTGASARSASPPNRIGMFPVITETRERVLLGLDDKHLDFRISVDVVPLGLRQQQITTTTLVRPHNLLGRAYLAAVVPFHRVIVPAMLGQVTVR